MKKVILILTLAMFALMTTGQTLIHTDILMLNNDTLLLKWSHEKFIDNDNPFELISRISLVKEYITPDTTYISRPKYYTKKLRINDSIKNPYGNNYYHYSFVKNYIYSTNEDLKRTLSLYHILNYKSRINE